MKTLLAAAVVMVLAAACDKPNVERTTELQLPQFQWDRSRENFLSGGHPLDIITLWSFDNESHGVSGMNVQIAPTSEGLSVVATGDDPAIRTPDNLSINGSEADLILVRMTRLTAAESWDGTLYYATNQSSESADRRAAPQTAKSPQIGVQVLLAYDMKQPSVGRAWRRSPIKQIRLDLDNEAGGAFLIHDIAIVRR